MHWNNILLQVIDFGSFSSLWYWIVVAIAWSTVSYFGLGVPYDVVQRARKGGESTGDELIDYVRLSVTRQLRLTALSGVWLIGFICFVLSTLFILGVWYQVEFALAGLLLALPMTVIGAMRVSTSRLIAAREPERADLVRILLRHRLWTQIIGLVSIFVTAMVGMFHNLSTLYVF